MSHYKISYNFINLLSSNLFGSTPSASSSSCATTWSSFASCLPVILSYAASASLLRFRSSDADEAAACLRLVGSCTAAKHFPMLIGGGVWQVASADELPQMWSFKSINILLTADESLHTSFANASMYGKIVDLSFPPFSAIVGIAS